MNRGRKEIWIIAGEASGDLYGARIASEIRRRRPDVVVCGMGGVEMRKAGVELLVDSCELGVIGLIEVLENIFKFIRIFLYLIREAKKRRPLEVILIDYPGFNIRFAKAMWKAGIPVVWYISPQVWAWRRGNIRKLARYCRKLMVIFPFEPEVYEGSGLDVEFVGHPLVDIVKGRADATIERDPNTILLLPGSRKKEIEYLLEPFLKTAAILKSRNPKLQFVVASPRERILQMVRDGIQTFMTKHPDYPLPKIELTRGKTAFWMQRCTAGLAASGTVTVECAIAGIPLVVVYRLNQITFLLARLIIGRLFRGFFTMPNIILNRCAFEEFLQFQVVPEDLADAMERILPGGSRRAQAEQDMNDVVVQLSGGASGAIAKAAACALSAIPAEK